MKWENQSAQKRLTDDPSFEVSLTLDSPVVF